MYVIRTKRIKSYWGNYEDLDKPIDVYFTFDRASEGGYATGMACWTRFSKNADQFATEAEARATYLENKNSPYIKDNVYDLNSVEICEITLSFVSKIKATEE